MMTRQEHAIAMVKKGHRAEAIARLFGVTQKTAKYYVRLANKSSGGPRMEHAVKLWAQGLDHAAIATRMGTAKSTAKAQVLRARLQGDLRAKARQ